MSEIYVNKLAPNFELEDNQNKLVSLKDFFGKKNVILVLNRGFN